MSPKDPTTPSRTSSRTQSRTLALRQPGIEILLCRQRHLESWRREDLVAPFWRLYWNPDPGAWLERDGKRYSLTPKKWTLISPGPHLKTGHRNPFQHTFIHFTLSPDHRPRHPLIHQGPLEGETQAHLHQLFTTPTPEPLATGLKALSLISLALSQLPESTWQAPPADHRIRRATEIMHQDPQGQKSCADIAERVGLHPKSFSRLFKQEMNIAPHRYHLHWRIDGAVADLMHNDTSVEAVADDWGFTDRHHFTRALKQQRAITPGQLKKQVRGLSD